MTKIPEREVLRYLRAPAQPEEALLAQVRDTISLFETQIAPHGIHQEVPLTVTEHTLSFAGCSFGRGAFYTHLKSCSAVLLFAATLGAKADRLTRAECARSTLRGAIAHAVGAAMIEQYCDDIQQHLAAGYEAQGVYLRPRYSPGYGDLPLSFQKDFFRLLPAEKHLGIELDAHFMMHPSKSVTAIIGLSDAPEKSYHKCKTCNHTNCPFRKEESDETIS